MIDDDGTGFTLNIREPKGGATVRTFSNRSGKEGVADGISASAHPKNGCDTLDFNGVPDTIKLTGGEVVQAFIQDQTGIYAVFFGAAVPGNLDDPAPGPRPYQASARLLLLATACRCENYRNQDTALIAYDVVSKYRHPAISARPEDFPPSGTVLDEFKAKGPVASVLDELLELTEDPDYGAGLDPTGYCFFRPNALKIKVGYTALDANTMEVSKNTISTATLWQLESEPAISPWAGSYVPTEVEHLSVPDPALHQHYGYESVRPAPQSALAPIFEAAFTAVGFSTPEAALAGTPGVSARTGTSVSIFTLVNEDVDAFGVQLLYRRDDAVGPVLFRASAGLVYYEVELPKSEGVMKPLRLPLPPHSGPFVKWDTFRLTVPAGGVFEVQEFFPLRLDTDKLDSAARAVVPELRPEQIVRKGVHANAAYVTLENAPRGARELPSAGLRYAWTPKGRAETVIDLGVSAYDGDPTKTNFVKSYYRS